LSLNIWVYKYKKKISLDVNLAEKNHAINCNYFNYCTCPQSSWMLLIYYNMYLLTVTIQRIPKVTKDSIIYHHTIIWLLFISLDTVNMSRKFSNRLKYNPIVWSILLNITVFIKYINIYSLVKVLQLQSPRY